MHIQVDTGLVSARLTVPAQRATLRRSAWGLASLSLFPLDSSEVSRELPGHQYTARSSDWITRFMRQACTKQQHSHSNVSSNAKHAGKQVPPRAGLKVVLPDMPLLAVEALKMTHDDTFLAQVVLDASDQDGEGKRPKASNKNLSCRGRAQEKCSRHRKGCLSGAPR